MLRFAALEDWNGRSGKNPTMHGCMEDFLTHYCCLVDFLGKSKPTSPTTTDVHVTNLREKMQLKTPSEVDEIYAEGQKLFAKYGDKAGR